MGEDVDPNDKSAHPPMNGAVLVMANILKIVTASAGETEIAATFEGGQQGAAMRTTLAEMGWPQTTTQIITDNECAEGFATRTIKQKRTKAIDMRFRWIICRSDQGQFLVLWRKGNANRADYFSKFHSAEYNLEMRPFYFHIPS